MLIEHLFGAAGLLPIQLALRFGPAEQRTICVGELCGFVPLGPFLEASQIDHVSHALTYRRSSRQRAARWDRAQSARAISGSITIKNSPYRCGKSLETASLEAKYNYQTTSPRMQVDQSACAKDMIYINFGTGHSDRNRKA